MLQNENKNFLKVTILKAEHYHVDKVVNSIEPEQFALQKVF